MRTSVSAIAPRVMANIVTPFGSEGELDIPELQRQVDRLAAAGVGVYCLSPGSGEVHSLSAAEYATVCSAAVEAASSRVPVNAMTPELPDIGEIRKFAGLGADAGISEVQLFQYMGGHGIVPGRSEQLNYWRLVLGPAEYSVSLSIHGYAGYLAPPELLAELCGMFDVIKTVYVHQGSLSQMLAIRDSLPDKVALGGDLSRALPEIVIGASIFNSIYANLVPVTCRRLVEAFVTGDVDAAGLAAVRVQELADALRPWGKPNSRALKMALRVLGLPCGKGPHRGPVELPAQNEFDKLAQRLEVIGIRDWEDLRHL